MDAGITNELVIESADTDVAGQIQQLQNLMTKNVDAILVNPGDVNGLNSTLLEALSRGIIVISVDQELNVPGVYNVGIDQKAWAMTSAQWQKSLEARVRSLRSRVSPDIRQMSLVWKALRKCWLTIPISRCLPPIPANGMRPPGNRSCPTSWR